MKQEDVKLERIRRPYVELQASVLAFAGAVLGGLGLFIMTVWLVIKGGDTVGPHLGLLGQYFPGYSVSWGGAFLGLFYGALAGGLAGAAVGWIYNFVATLRRR